MKRLDNIASEILTAFEKGREEGRRVALATIEEARLDGLLCSIRLLILKKGIPLDSPAEVRREFSEEIDFLGLSELVVMRKLKELTDLCRSAFPLSDGILSEPKTLPLFC